MNIKELAEAYTSAKTTKEFWGKETEQLRKDLYHKMVEEDMQSVKLEDGTSCYLQSKISAKYNPDDEPQVLNFCKQEGQADIFQYKVHHATFSSTIQALVDQGVIIPDFIRLETNSYVNVSGGKK